MRIPEKEEMIQDIKEVLAELEAKDDFDEYDFERLGDELMAAGGELMDLFEGNHETQHSVDTEEEDEP